MMTMQVTRRWSGSVTHPYDTIPKGMDNASVGETIRVYNGTYVENVLVNRTVPLIGNGSSNTTIDGSGTGDVVRITSNWVNITGFNVTNSGTSSQDAGMKINNADNCTIESCEATLNQNGFYISRSPILRLRITPQTRTTITASACLLRATTTTSRGIS